MVNKSYKLWFSNWVKKVQARIRTWNPWRKLPMLYLLSYSQYIQDNLIVTALTVYALSPGSNPGLFFSSVGKLQLVITPLIHHHENTWGILWEYPIYPLYYTWEHPHGNVIQYSLTGWQDKFIVFRLFPYWWTYCFKWK